MLQDVVLAHAISVPALQVAKNESRKDGEPLTWERLPPTVAVNGFPERTLTLPLMVQSFIRAPFQPFTSVPPLWPMPVLYWNCRLRLCRASKLESPRSAARSNQFCATGVLPCPRPPVPALSIDFEN